MNTPNLDDLLFKAEKNLRDAQEAYLRAFSQVIEIRVQRNLMKMWMADKSEIQPTF